ncbi:MAG: hypothetical protein A2X31_05170 [Elusimicrobia bacterium GWB2_63_22]|nr:MAG: hypothetical protein A2X31_05170 [Elusimicrobia bacterium GWB2_63_22]
MKISVLISTYNRRSALARTLEAVLTQAYPLEKLEIVVLDDFGTDGTYEELGGKTPELLSRGLRGFRAMRNERNRGIAYGRMRLSESAAPDSEALLYLDDDVYLEKNTIGGLVRCLEEKPGCALVGPRLVYAAAPEKTAHCANYVGRWSGRYSELDSSSETECDWLNSSCFLARRKAIGGVRHAEDFYTAHEEVDFCLQLKNSGYSVIYSPGVRALHDLPLSTACRRERLYYLYRNKLLIFKRNFPAARMITASLITCLLGLPLYLLESLRYNKGVNTKELKLVFRAVLDGLSGRSGKI